MQAPILRRAAVAVLVFALILGGSVARAEVDADVRRVIETYCVSCHGPDRPKGEVRLDVLETLTGDARLNLLTAMDDVIRVGEMPPKNAKRPTAAERKLLGDWLGRSLTAGSAAKLGDKLRKPEYGNYVDHEKLFSGEYADLPGFTYDRRWLISEYIFDAKFQRMLKARSNRAPLFGEHDIKGLSLANPFLLPKRTGVRYYADTDLTGGHLSSMLTNAQKAAVYITDGLAKRDQNFLPVIGRIMALEDEHEATLASRREFLESFVETVCGGIYGDENERLLPAFVPVKLNPVGAPGAGETYKKLPRPVAMNTLENLGGDHVFYQLLLNPEHARKSDREIQELCERTWFFRGDHARAIQGRLAILREYIADFRANLDADGRRYKLLVYKPLADREMEAIRASIRKHRKAGDFYAAVIDKCTTDWDREFAQARSAAGPPSDALLSELVGQLFVHVLERQPEVDEAAEHLRLVKTYVDKLGARKAIQKLIQTLILTSEFVYRSEFGVGAADRHGRRMLSPRDASCAIAYALTDQSPDKELARAAASGRLETKEDYRREVARILAKRDVNYVIDKALADKDGRWDNTTDTAIRKLRFFREFFGYPEALAIFKDEKRFGGDRLENATARLLSEADRIVEHVLQEDRDVFERLLATEEFYVYHDGDNARMQAASDRIKRIYEHFKDTDWRNFKKEDLLDHRDFLKEVKMRSVDPDKLDARNRQGTTIQLFKMSMRSITARLDKGQKEAAPFDLYRGYGNDFMSGYNVGKFFNYALDDWDYATRQPAKVPNRKGMLTHPAWLIAHAQNTETDPVVRGKWVREKLLAGTIPDVPITVDAVVPEDHDRTLRSRLAGATETDYCWRCHQRMNPLGYAFEIYDDFGRFRRDEPLEYPEHLLKKGPEQKGDHLVDTRDVFETRPVDATGRLDGTGDPALDGDVADALDLVDRLARSRRVRQSIIRHAFRYFLGRNEQLSDSKTLIDAEQAYVDGGGSFDAVIVSLLTSDSFVYRKALEE